MIPENQENSGKSGYEEMHSLILELCDDLADLKHHFYLISAAYLIEEEPSLTAKDDNVYDAEDMVDKAHFFLSLFVGRFTFKEIKTMATNAERLHRLIRKLDQEGKKS